MSHARNLIALALVLLGTFAGNAVGQAEPPEGPVVLITGSNRGIGLEFARQYAEAGWNVIATARSPDAATDLHVLAEEHPRVRIERLDVTDAEQVGTLARKYEAWPIDVLLNNAGVLGSATGQSLTVLDEDEFQRVMAVNAFAPLRVTQAFLDHVARSDQKEGRDDHERLRIVGARGAWGRRIPARIRVLPRQQGGREHGDARRPRLRCRSRRSVRAVHASFHGERHGPGGP